MRTEAAWMSVTPSKQCNHVMEHLPFSVKRGKCFWANVEPV